MIWEDLYLCYLHTSPIDFEMVKVLQFGTLEQAEQYYISHCEINPKSGMVLNSPKGV